MTKINHHFLHHLVVRDLIGAEAIEAGARIEHEIEHGPGLRRQDIGFSVLRRIGLVDGRHHFVGDAGKGLAAAELFVYHPGRRGCLGIDHQVVAGAHPFDFAEMVIDAEMGVFGIWQVGENVVAVDFDLAILHLLGLGEFHLADHLQLHQQAARNGAIEIGTSDETKFVCGHGTRSQERADGERCRHCRAILASVAR